MVRVGLKLIEHLKLPGFEGWGDAIGKYWRLGNPHRVLLSRFADPKERGQAVVILIIAVVPISGQTPKRLLALISARVVHGRVKSDLT